MFGASLSFRLSDLQAVSFSAEFAPVEVSISRDSKSGDGSLTIKSPKERLGRAHFQSPDGWHMTYVDELSLRMTAKLRISEIAFGAEYSLRV